MTFLSVEEPAYYGYNIETKQHKFRWKIIDSEFEEEVDIEYYGPCWLLVIIDVYERRNLPVAANLVLAMVTKHKGYGWTVNELIEWCRIHSRKFPKYEQDIKKYLTLI